MSEKSQTAQKEEEILKFWQENKIFEKSLNKPSSKGEFVFYEGPPTANGRPGIHHLEARAFKDAVPRYKTMRGYHVRRKGGWDTHGLPVEIETEKQLGLKSKKEIEAYGIAAFNEKCKESVWKYVDEWQKFTDRIGYWVDQKNPYITYTSDYIESLWWIVGEVNKRQLLYKDYKVLPWCPRCGTALSSHELAQGYQTDKDLAVTVKLKIVGFPNAFFLAWTTTPWTLPGNVALAVGSDMTYVEVKVGEEILVLAKERLSVINSPYEIIAEHKGSEMVGMEYEPLYPFLLEKFKDKNSDAFAKAYKVYAAPFVTTEDGTGIVHTAVMYGQDDFELGDQVGLPKSHLVKEDGHFIEGTDFLAGKFVKDEETAVLIIKDLASRALLFKKEKYEHSYPHCWRCKTPLIYYARDSWYIAMSKLRDKLISENQKVNWEPAHIKDGRFGEWLREVKDWAISRERYWATPLPVWECNMCQKFEVVGSLQDLADKLPKPNNRYVVIRHGETLSNGSGKISYKGESNDHLVDKGRAQVKESAEKLKKENITKIIRSPFARAKETADIIAETIGLSSDNIIEDKRLAEINLGDFDGTTWEEYHARYPKTRENFTVALPGGESYFDVEKRVVSVLLEAEEKYSDETVLIVTHGGPASLLVAGASGSNWFEAVSGVRDIRSHFNFDNAEYQAVDFKKLPRNNNLEIDVHRPYIDGVTWGCDCGGTFSRVKEVMDVWFDSGAMPFAQSHYMGKGELLYPADFISEAIDQTRGWFYTLLAVAVLLGREAPYKNVICLGHILDAEGKKMSKSVGNVVNPWDMIEKYGVDVLRFWMYSVNQPGESKNFDEKTVDEIHKKLFTVLQNVAAFYDLQKEFEAGKDARKSTNILDRWILAMRDKLVDDVTKSLDGYDLFSASRTIKEFVTELSQWYVRRSRDRFKVDGEDREFAAATLKLILLDLSRLLAPFTPFFAEEIYRIAGGSQESVHLDEWPASEKLTEEQTNILKFMSMTRSVVSQALELRSKANIKVRQPLKSLKLPADSLKLSGEYLELISDEVNVKEVIVGDKIELDTEITPELKREGEYRDLVREVQDLRKEKGLKPGDMVVISLPEKFKEILSGLETDFSKTVSAKGVMFGDDKIKIEERER